MSLSEAYATLEVVEWASERVVRGAYKARARDTHPDTGGAEEQFKRVEAAFATIEAAGFPSKPGAPAGAGAPESDHPETPQAKNPPTISSPRVGRGLLAWERLMPVPIERAPDALGRIALGVTGTQSPNHRRLFGGVSMEIVSVDDLHRSVLIKAREGLGDKTYNLAAQFTQHEDATLATFRLTWRPSGIMNGGKTGATRVAAAIDAAILDLAG